MNKFCPFFIAILLLTGTISCDKNDDPSGNADFKVPELTLLNTIQFTVDIKSNYSVEVFLRGSKMAVDWGDGTMSKAEDQRTEYRIDLNRMSHGYKSRGKYRIKIWSEHLTGVSLSGFLRAYSDIHVGNCPMLAYAVVNSFTDGRSINLNGCPQLEELHLSNNELLESVTLDNCLKLRKIISYTNPALAPLDLSNHSELSLVYCSDHAVDIQKLPKTINDLEYVRNDLDEIYLKDFTELTSFTCTYSNLLTTLRISGCDKLKELYFSNTAVNSFDFSECPALTTVQCSGTELTAIDISHNPYLRTLDCSHNKLSTLDVSANDNMRFLYLNDNLFEKDALETIFTALPTYNQQLVVSGAPVINIAGNPGSATCNKQIAVSKYWSVRDR